MKVGVVALQGAFESQAAVFAELGVDAIAVKHPDALGALDAVVLPGGESTTMSLLLESSGLFEPLARLLDGGMPALGTCAGMILLASAVVDGRGDQRTFGAIDLTVRRNGFGRQVDSFETDLTVTGLRGGDFHAVFIRAPVVERAGDGVEVLAALDGHPVLCRQGAVLVSAFHPELAGDLRLHQLFLEAT